MTVAEILEGAGLTGELDREMAALHVSGLEYDSRRVGPGTLFFAFLGEQFDARQFVPQAMERGAVAVVCDAPPPDGFTAPWILVRDGRRALATSARNFHRAAVEKVSVTGITGTNGKTTTAHLVDSIARAAGRTTALMGTIEYVLAGRRLKALNTTPESLDIYRMLAELASLGGTHAVMEVSSHALAQGRVHGLQFHTAAFTNLTRDHLDYHKTIDAYFEAKSLLFAGGDVPAPRYAVLNRDDEYAASIQVAAGTEVLWYGLGAGAGVRGEKVRAGFDGVRFNVVWNGQRHEVSSPLLGRMNVYNILAALAVGISYEVTPETLIRGIADCHAVPGRFERIVAGQPFLVVVDYAHTDDALRNVIAAARELRPKRLITLFGCGGDRDRTKRPLMGEAAATASDIVVLTSDNPRSEDPVAIMNDALVGLRRHDTELHMEPDRRTAIRIALDLAHAGDIVLLAGKGHETYQILRDGPIPFDDREAARDVLRRLRLRRGGQAMTISLGDVAGAIGSSVAPPSVSVSGWSVDTRTIQPGDLFFALQRTQPRRPSTTSPRRFEKGAVAAVVDRPVETGGVLLPVSDSLAALQALAAWARRRWAGTVVAITGSAGKTTTKDTIAQPARPKPASRQDGRQSKQPRRTAAIDSATAGRRGSGRDRARHEPCR